MEPGSNRVAVALVAVCAVLVAASHAKAGVCHERCGQAYSSCAAVEAVGCELGADLVGKVASELGNQIPIPGMGALFGGLAKKGTKEACQKKLAPCQKIKDTCLAECGPAEAGGATAGGTTGSTAAPLPSPVSKATFRVFSDRPRTIVYVNGERMGATPQDPLEPFVTPELRVGKYWVRLVTPDEKWEWVGAKDVEEGNINAVEGKLENVEKKAWAAALSLDRQGEALKTIEAYDAFVRNYPDSDHVTVALARISGLREQIEAAERELYSRIEGEGVPETRLALCAVYIERFPEGPNRQRVDELLAQTKRDMETTARDAAALEARQKALADAARRAAEEAEEKRRSVGRAQRGWGVTLMALGGASGLTGGILGGVTLSQYKDLESGCGSTSAGCSQSVRDENLAKAVATNWLLGVAVISAVTGIVVYATAPSAEKENPTVTAAIAPTPNGAVLGLGGSF